MNSGQGPYRSPAPMTVSKQRWTPFLLQEVIVLAILILAILSGIYFTALVVRVVFGPQKRQLSLSDVAESHRKSRAEVHFITFVIKTFPNEAFSVCCFSRDGAVPAYLCVAESREYWVAALCEAGNIPSPVTCGEYRLGTGLHIH